MAQPEILSVPPVEAIEHFRAKGYKLGFDWRDTEAAEHVISFTVAKAMQVDILTDIRRAVDEAFAEGHTFPQFYDRLTPTLQSKGWWGRRVMADPLTGEKRLVQLGSPWRLRTIFDTNLRMAHAHGRWTRIERLKDAMPYLRYVAILDARTRPEHAEWHGTVLPVDHPFWQTHYPPNGWRCRCIVVQLGEDDLERYGYRVSSDPTVRTRPWTNRRTGEIVRVPAGIDPGFAHNVGTVDRTAQARALLRQKAAASPVAPEQPLVDVDHYLAEGYGIRQSFLATVGDPDAPDFPRRLRSEIVRRLRAERGAGSVAAVIEPLSETAGSLAAADRVREAAALLPSRWVTVANATPARVTYNGQRAGGFYRPADALLSVSDDPSNAVHEYVHHLQHTVPELQAPFTMLHARRTTQPDGTFDPWLPLAPDYLRVRGRKDQYIDAYFGAHRTRDDPPLEVITRGMQIVLHSLHGRERLDVLFREDPQMLDLVLGVLYRYDP